MIYDSNQVRVLIKTNEAYNTDNNRISGTTALVPGTEITSRYIVGLATDSPIEAARAADAFIPYVGLRGRVAFSMNHDKTGTVTLTLEQMSPSNRLLQRLADSGFMFDLDIIDNNPQTVGSYFGDAEGGGTGDDGASETGVQSVGYVSQPAECFQCVVQTVAPLSKTNEISTREWTIFCGSITIDGATLTTDD